jgi:4,5-dihydroxyphthalate decarboxylase
MDPVPVTLATRDYEHIAPLALGDVKPAGVTLTVIRAFDALERVAADPAIHGGEASFARHIQRVAAGDRAYVGLPAFVMLEFRHRCFFLRRGSPLRELADLAGARIGLDAWPATGNTWTRGLLREAGVPQSRVDWVVGPINPGAGARAADPLPAGVRAVAPGGCLRDMLVAGELDVLVAAWPPEGFYAPDSPIVRMFPDYRAAERAHFRRHGIYPAQHVVVLKRALVDRHPQVVGSLYRALCEARERADRARLDLHESSPWLLADLEESRELLGPGFSPYGYRENRRMVAAFCEEQHAQGLIAHPLDPDAVFADFEALVKP